MSSKNPHFCHSADPSDSLCNNKDFLLYWRTPEWSTAVLTTWCQMSLSLAFFYFVIIIVIILYLVISKILKIVNT